jgi:glycerol-3-phosphate dehydrogenase
MGRRPVAICGSGNGGHALAVVLSQNFEGGVNWLIGSEEKADLLRRRTSVPGLQSTGGLFRLIRRRSYPTPAL